MSWLKKLRGSREGATPTALEEAPTCPHATLIPRWETADEIGKEELASGFRCDACGEEFTPDQAAFLRATEAARIRQNLN